MLCNAVQIRFAQHLALSFLLLYSKFSKLLLEVHSDKTLLCEFPVGVIFFKHPSKYAFLKNARISAPRVISQASERIFDCPTEGLIHISKRRFHASRIHFQNILYVYIHAYIHQVLIGIYNLCSVLSLKKIPARLVLLVVILRHSNPDFLHKSRDSILLPLFKQKMEMIFDERICDNIHDRSPRLPHRRPEERCFCVLLFFQFFELSEKIAPRFCMVDVIEELEEMPTVLVVMHNRQASCSTRAYMRKCSSLILH